MFVYGLNWIYVIGALAVDSVDRGRHYFILHYSTVFFNLF